MVFKHLGAIVQVIALRSSSPEQMLRIELKETTLKVEDDRNYQTL